MEIDSLLDADDDEVTDSDLDAHGDDDDRSEGYCPRHERDLPGSLGDPIMCDFCGSVLLYGGCSDCVNEAQPHSWCKRCKRWYCGSHGGGVIVAGTFQGFLCNECRAKDRGIRSWEKFIGHLNNEEEEP